MFAILDLILGHLTRPMHGKEGAENLIQCYGFHFGPEDLKDRCHGSYAKGV